MFDENILRMRLQFDHCVNIIPGGINFALVLDRSEIDFIHLVK